MILRDSRATNPGYRAGTRNGEGGTPYSWGSCIAFFGCHTATISNVICDDRTCPSTANYDINSGDLESFSMCTDEGNGHMITFHPHYWFNGEYGNWDDMSNGMCEVDVSDISYLWMHDDNPEIDPNNIVDRGRNRDWIARSMHNEDWNGSLGPRVCWDGDCQWAGEFESTQSSSSVASIAGSSIAGSSNNKHTSLSFVATMLIASIAIAVLVTFQKQQQQQHRYHDIIDVE